MARTISDARWDFEDVKLSLCQRAFIYLRGVWYAVKEMPPKTQCRHKRILPGETGYENAPMIEVLDTWPLRYDTEQPTKPL